MSESLTRALLRTLTDVITPLGYQFSTAFPTGGWSSTPIFWQDMPAAPDRGVCLTALPVTDNPHQPLGLWLVQVRARGRPGVSLDCDDDCDAIFAALEGLAGLEMADVSLVQVRRQLSAPMGIDDQKRRERADHYEIDVEYPATTLRPGAGAW